jgi:FAD/FMN-containing dehydrogenase
MLVVLYFQHNGHQEGARTTRTDANMMKEILDIVHVAKRHLGEVLAAVEWMDPNTVRCITEAFPNLKLPSLIKIPKEDAMASDGFTRTEDDSSVPQVLFPHVILFETHGTQAEHDQEKRDSFLNAFMGLKCNDDSGNLATSRIIYKDVKMARNQSDAPYFWSIRESANPATAQLGYTYKYDLSIPNSNFSSIMEFMYERLIDYHHRIVISNWGHILDGNLHLNITDVNNFQRDDGLSSVIEPSIYEQVLRVGGSIAAEHGVGQIKNHYMDQIHSPSMIRLMRSIKQVFDPRGILNPGKVLPPAYLDNLSL